jgi:hypothetical protein
MFRRVNHNLMAGRLSMHSKLLFTLVIIAAISAPAFAQAPPSAPPMRVRGTIAKVADHTLTINARGGDTVTVALAPDVTVRTVVAKTLADIKPGDKVGITSVSASEGGRQTVEIHIFSPSMTTVRMGEFPWDLKAGSLMTNAPVAEVDSAPEKGMITVSFNGKQSKFAVPSGTPVVAFETGDAGLLTPGAAVFVIARKQPDGGLSAASVTVEKNGVKPPM